ncbi:MAG: chemotaxis protein CheZ [bacterium]|jgi:chemotaxis protein CheZ
MAIDIIVSHIQSLSNLLESLDKESSEYSALSQVITNIEPLLKQLLEGNIEDVEKIEQEISIEIDRNALFSELGSVVRQLFDCRKKLEIDITGQIKSIHTLDMQDATERLTHILEMTDRAAHRTMDLSEVMLNSLDELVPVRNALEEKVQNLLEQETNSSYKEIFQEVQQYLEKEKEKNDQYQITLTDVLIAQDYQDLTGQVIKRIISLINDTEDKLVDLLKRFNPKIKATEQVKEELQGPLPTASEKRFNQDSIDELLEELGFN